MHGGARVFRVARALGHLADGRFDQRLDLARGLRAALRQRPHLARDHREALALLARPGRFNGGVQRQDVGLERDPVDDRDNLGNLARAGGNIAHRAHHRRHDGAAALGDFGGACRQLIGLARIVGILLDGRRQLFHRCGGFFQRCGLLFGPAGQVRVAGRDLPGCAGDGFGPGANGADGAGQLVLHIVQRAQQPAGFIAGNRVNGLPQVATRHGLRHRHCLGKRRRDRLGHPPREQAAQHDGQARQDQVQHARVVDHPLAVGAGVHHLCGLNPGDLDDAVLQAIQKRKGLFQQALASGVALTTLEECAHALE
ncbi:Uncharacterised protein [Achromobacter xylosoxidans]|nr:Uncharacterised protein [Achromobacter xylosoxidans]